ncbi:MAG: hypothetical protein ACJ74Z_13620 [Bryobacteraceae bacterium]
MCPFGQLQSTEFDRLQ